MLAILHGSQVSGHIHEHSDWDVGILADHTLDDIERAKLRHAFASKFKVSEDVVDIADLRSDAPLLRYRVAMQGKLIEGDPQEFRKFQIAAWKDYLNNEKMFALRTKFLNKAL